MNALDFVMEVFACAGGLAEGFRRAGIEIHLVIDRDPEACDSYEANLGRRPVQMDVNDLARMVELGWRPERPIGLLVADPPCAPWSKAGKRRGVDDERDCLVVTCKLVSMLRPTSWMIANVPGLDEGPSWPIAQRLIGGLSAHGYCIDYASLDAADYGVPQHRRRPFWFGHLLGSPCIRWPAATHGDPRKLHTLALPGVAGLSPWVTCRQALAHLLPKDLGRPIGFRRRRQNGLPQSERVDPVDQPARTVRAKQEPIAVEPWPWPRPATAVTGREVIGPPGHHDGWEGGLRSHPNAILLSERAGAALQAFPDGWKFLASSKKRRWEQIGQAVPPPVAEAIGRSIAAWAEATEALTTGAQSAARR